MLFPSFWILQASTLELQYPPLLLCLSLQAYRGPRVLCGEGVSSLALYPQQGLLQGCPLAPSISKLAMFDPVVAASQMPGVQHCDLWLDDCSLDVTHADADIVAAQALEVYRCLKTDLSAQGLQVNVNKTHFTCSSAKAEKCLKKILKEGDPEVSSVVKDLGVEAFRLSCKAQQAAPCPSTAQASSADPRV